MKAPKRLAKFGDVVEVRSRRENGEPVWVELDLIKFLLGFGVIKNDPKKDELVFLINALVETGNFFTDFNREKKNVLLREKKEILWTLLTQNNIVLDEKYDLYEGAGKWVADTRNLFQPADIYIQPGDHDSLISYLLAMGSDYVNENFELIQNSFTEVVYKIPKNMTAEELLDFSRFSILEQSILKNSSIVELVNKMQVDDLEEYRLLETDQFELQDQEDFYFFRKDGDTLVECSRGFLRRGFKKWIGRLRPTCRLRKVLSWIFYFY